jgi:hypothetical protein
VTTACKIIQFIFTKSLALIQNCCILIHIGKHCAPIAKRKRWLMNNAMNRALAGFARNIAAGQKEMNNVADILDKEYKTVTARVANNAKREGAEFIMSVGIKGLKYYCYKCPKRGKIKAAVL